MNKLEKIKKYLILFCLVLLALLVFLVAIPFCINLLFKWYTGPLLAWEDDAGAMLEFYGAVLGGGITLLVLWITTDETRKIQKKNEDQMEDDRKEREREKRKAFADSVIEDFSKFCADSSSFKESQERIKEYKAEIEDIKTQLEEIKNEFEEKYEEYLIQGDDEVVPRMKRLDLDKKDLEDKIEFKRRSIEMIYTSRKTTQERFLVLSIKLDGIEGADHIIERMNHLRRVGKDENINFEDYLKDHKEVIKEMTTFIKKYVEG